MDELGYDKESNLAKNFMLFQFFSDTLEIKSKDLKHLPFKYDFDDYMGIKDWSKMFVSKLLEQEKASAIPYPDYTSFLQKKSELKLIYHFPLIILISSFG